MLWVSPVLTVYICVLTGILGACMGSFLNCMAWRIVHGESVLHGRSHCDVCGHVLGAGDLIPVLSYIMHKGRCKYCGAKLSAGHVFAEVLTALTFLLLVLKYISATTKPSDVLGLTNGSVYNQISLPHTPKKSTTSYTGTTVEYPENGPAMQKSALFLYATDEYTNLKGFTVDQIEITAGETTYTVVTDGITTDENHTYTDENHTYKVTVSDQWTTKTNDTKFRYRAVKVESAAAGEITLKIVLKNGDVTYNLTTPYTIASNTYTVKFLDTKDNVLLTKTVDYGKKPELTEEDKANLKADAELGYTCTWALSEIYADTKIHPTLKPNTYTIQFDANGGSGTMSDVSYAYDKIQTTDSLPPNKFTKGTSAFKGWALTAADAEKYTDMSSIKNIIDSMAMENKTELTLYAVWEDTAAGGETVEP